MSRKIKKACPRRKPTSDVGEGLAVTGSNTFDSDTLEEQCEQLKRAPREARGLTIVGEEGDADGDNQGGDVECTNYCVWHLYLYGAEYGS